MSAGAIRPPPPMAVGVGLPWDVEVADPVAALAEARARLGDTFVVDSGPDRYLFTFSPTGVESFYALPEEQASKGVADWRMLRRKLPDDIFSGRRTLPHQLFGREDVALYLANLDRALDQSIAELGESGTIDVFDLTRRLGHRLGLASWGGPGSSEGAGFDRLVAAFDALDGAEAFVHPDAMAAVAASGKAAEIEALAVVVDVVGAAADTVEASPRLRDEHPLFVRIVDAWSDEPPAERRRGIALDVALIHVASMSNLASALGWALIHLLAAPDEKERVTSGDRARTEQCVLESTRLAQRSIMARFVVSPVVLDVGDATYSVDAGVTIATLLPLTNTTAGPGLDAWDPDRWHRRRFADTSGPASPQLVTAFGHGKHTCPAQPFSLAAMSTALARILGQLDLTPEWTERPGPVSAQIGGVARAEAPCPVHYRRLGRRRGQPPTS